MAAVFETGTNFDSAASTSHNISHTNISGNFLIVGFTNLSTGGDIVTGVTYNSVALTKITPQAATNGRTANMWYLANPSTGANTLNITLSASFRIMGTVATYTGVNTTTPIDTTARGQVNSGTAFDQNITTGVANATLFAAAYINRTVSSYGTNTTNVYNVLNTHQTTRSTADVASPGATSLSFTMATAEAGAAWVIASINPSTGGAAASNQYFTMMGVG